MAKTTNILATALLALVAATTTASALDLKAGGEPKLKATKIQLGILSPEDNVCPGDAKRQVWVFTNKPGIIPILIVRQGGAVEGPYNIETVKGANGLSMGTWSDDLNIVNPIDAKYKVVTPNSDAASNWVPLIAQC